MPPAHVIYKMNRGRQGDHAPRHQRHVRREPVNFNLPTDIAFAPNGDLYVTDGYGGARVVKFSRDGKYLLEWGKRGTGPANSACRITSSSTHRDGST